MGCEIIAVVKLINISSRHLVTIFVRDEREHQKSTLSKFPEFSTVSVHF